MKGTKNVVPGHAQRYGILYLIFQKLSGWGIDEYCPTCFYKFVKLVFQAQELYPAHGVFPGPGQRRTHAIPHLFITTS